MRKQKPLPKESSFKEFADNKSKRPKTRTRTKKPRFQIKDDKPVSSGRSSGRRTSFKDRSSRSSDLRGSVSRSRSRNGDNYRGPNRISGSGNKRDSRTSSRGPVKHDRRSSQGKSFKEDRRDSRDERRPWDSIPKNKRGDERRARGKTEMFDAVCKKCGKDCKVPFKPQMSKGVSCRDCFQKNATDNYRRSSGARFSKKRESFSGGSNQRFARTDGGVRELFDAVCMKCKKPCKVPFKPTGKMGVSCSNCFVKSERPSDRRKSGGRTSFGRGRSSNRSRR